MTAIERLEEMLNAKDEEIDNLKEDLRLAELDHSWMAHTNWETDPRPELPVPRLELATIGPGEGCELFVEYRMVYRHFQGTKKCPDRGDDLLVCVPLGGTRINGVRAESKNRDVGYLPFRDSVHIKHDAQHLGMPAFVISESGKAETLEAACKRENLPFP